MDKLIVKNTKCNINKISNNKEGALKGRVKGMRRGSRWELKIDSNGNVFKGYLSLGC